MEINLDINVTNPPMINLMSTLHLLPAAVSSPDESSLAVTGSVSAIKERKKYGF
jgi:hypothetical protein